jgi:hypothetical protein
MVSKKLSPAIKKIEFIAMGKHAQKPSVYDAVTPAAATPQPPVSQTSMVLVDTIAEKPAVQRFTLPKFLNRRTVTPQPQSSPTMNQNSPAYSDAFFSQFAQQNTTATDKKTSAFQSYFHQQVKEGDTKNVKISVILGISALSFVTLCMQTASLVTANMGALMATVVLFLASTSLAGMLIKSRKIAAYFSLGLFAAGCLIHFFMIGSLTVLSGFVLALIAVFIFRSFGETRKNIIASRIVYINGMTKAALAMLELAVIGIIGIGLFSTIIHEKSPIFVSKTLIGQEFVQDALTLKDAGPTQKILESNGIVTLPKFQTEYASIEANKGKPSTIRDLMIWADYDAAAKNILSEEETKKIDAVNRFEPKEKQQSERTAAANAKLQIAFAAKYASTGLTLETPVTTPSYTTFIRQQAYNTVNDFETGQANSPVTISALKAVPKSLLVASLISLGLVLVLFAIRLVLKSITGLIEFFTGLTLRLIVWELLKVTRVVRVDVAQVEAEVITL